MGYSGGTPALRVTFGRIVSPCSAVGCDINSCRRDCRGIGGKDRHYSFRAQFGLLVNE